MSRTTSYFVMQKFMLRLSAISFKQCETTYYNIFSKISFFIACLYPVLVVGDLFKQDFNTVADLLGYEIPLAVGIIKAVTVLINRKKIAQILDNLDGHLNLNNFINGDKQNKQLMKKCIFITNAQTATYWIMIYTPLAIGIIAAILMRIKSSDYHEFPYGRFTFLNVTYSPNYEISLALQCFSVVYLGNQYINVDLLLAAVLIQICFHLKILQNNLRRIVENTSKKMTTLNDSNTSTIMEEVNCSDTEIAKIDWNNLHASLKEQVNHHLEIINTAEELNESFSLILLPVFLANLGTEAFVAYKASMSPIGDARMLQTLGELCAAVLHVLIMCFWGEQMMFESGQVGYAAYQANFVGTDLRFQRSLVLIMRRSQNPIRITAGYIGVSLATFTWIVQSTYSYYTILTTQNNLNEG